VVVCVELPAGYDPARVLLSTVTLNGVVPAIPERSQLGDFNQNGVPGWMFRFDRAAVENLLPTGDAVPVTVTGEVEDLIWFTAADMIRVIRPAILHPNGGETLVAWSVVPISWNDPEGWPVDHATILYSADAGQTWSMVAEGVTGTSYDWRVPEGVTDAGLVRVFLHDHRGVMGYDTSDGPFAVRSAQTGIEEAIPSAHRLYQNAPNPFLGTTEIPFDLPAEGTVAIKVYDLQGRAVRTVAQAWYPAGSHRVTWNGRDDGGNALAAGVYFYRLEVGTFVSTRRMSVLPR
jgi:hypothetical protein